MIRFDDLESKVLQYHPRADLKLLRKAYDFSAREHEGQVRQSGEPYLSHPLEVAHILAEMKLDVACICVGLLHDVVEDTLVSNEKIQEQFGEDLAHIVDGLTKISKIRFSSKQERQAENFRKLLMAMVDDIRVILVKLADRLHNMRTLEHLLPGKRRAIAQETLDVYAPIAHRLGMAKIRGELEDRAFRYLDPVAYENILAQVKRKQIASNELIPQLAGTMEHELKEAGIEAKIENRIKRIYSIHQKMKRQKVDLSQVFDFIAIRVLVPTVRDCYTVLGILHNIWRPVPGRIKDFIAMARQNMYQSLHTTVVAHNGQSFEIQIRTYDMHRVAEEGIAAHWKYKEGNLSQDKEDKRFQWLRHLLQWQHGVKDPQQFLSSLKIDLYPEEVYTFTPKGEVITLSRGATPVDFAYAIHTAVGHRCVGAKINGRIVPLKSRLSNGEMVEILTSKEGFPSPDWLKFVRTPKARSNIRRWVNTRQREKAISLGEKLLEKEARKFKLNLKNYADSFEMLLPEFRVSKMEDLFASLGFGRIAARNVLRQLDPEKTRVEVPGNLGSSLTEAIRRTFRGADSTIRVSGYDDILVYRAKCCNPIRGEEIIGYITIGRGISVHSINCSNLLILNPDRKVEVQWTSDSGKATYPVRLQINTDDRTGVIADVTSAISGINTNIVNMEGQTVDNRYGLIEVTVEIMDTDHLEKIMNFIKGVSGVRQVERSRSRIQVHK